MSNSIFLGGRKREEGKREGRVMLILAISSLMCPRLSRDNRIKLSYGTSRANAAFSRGLIRIDIIG